MAQYYRAPRTEISLFQTDSSSLAAATTTPSDQTPLVDDLELGDIYIFPHPSSEPPLSPSQFSELSPATDFSYSGLSEPSLRDPSPESLSLSLSPVDVSGGAEEDASWLESPAATYSLSSITLAQQREQWEQVLWRRVSRRDLSSAHTPHPRLWYSQSPHPRFHIPLLSYFISLLSIDDETVHLLHHTSHQSVLFPGTNVIDATTEGGSFDAPQSHHAVSKLLLRSALEREAQTSVREGLAVVYSSTSVSHTLPFSGIFSLVSSLVSNGGKALREVLYH